MTDGRCNLDWWRWYCWCTGGATGGWNTNTGRIRCYRCTLTDQKFGIDQNRASSGEELLASFFWKQKCRKKGVVCVMWVDDIYKGGCLLIKNINFIEHVGGEDLVKEKWDVCNFSNSNYLYDDWLIVHYTHPYFLYSHKYYVLLWLLWPYFSRCTFKFLFFFLKHVI